MEETLSKLVGAKDNVGVSRMIQQGGLELRLLDTLHSLTVGRWADVFLEVALSQTFGSQLVTKWVSK